MPSLVSFLNKVDTVDDPEILEFVKMELRDKIKMVVIPCSIFGSRFNFFDTAYMNQYEHAISWMIM